MGKWIVTQDYIRGELCYLVEHSVTGVIWKGFCIIFAFEFSWWIPIILLVLSICFIVTGEEGEL